MKLQSSPKAQKATELRVEANRANAAACKLLGRLVRAKSQIEIGLLSPEDRFRPIREALEKLDFATMAPASNRWPAVVRFDEEDVLQALDKFEMLLDAIPITDGEATVKINLSGPLSQKNSRNLVGGGEVNCDSRFARRNNALLPRLWRAFAARLGRPLPYTGQLTEASVPKRGSQSMRGS